jgi:hypothetical protein
MNNITYTIDRNSIHYNSLIEIVNRIDNEIIRIDKKKVNVTIFFRDEIAKLRDYVINNFIISHLDTNFEIYYGFQNSHRFTLCCDNNKLFILSYVKYNKNMFYKRILILGMIICYDDYPCDNLLMYRNGYLMENGLIKIQKPALQFVNNYHIQ